MIELVPDKTAVISVDTRVKMIQLFAVVIISIYSVEKYLTSEIPCPKSKNALSFLKLNLKKLNLCILNVVKLTGAGSDANAVLCVWY